MSGAAATGEAVARTTSALSGVSSDAGGMLVSESLEGLVSAVDELKRSMGLGEQVDLSAIEQFIGRMKQARQQGGWVGAGVGVFV